VGAVVVSVPPHTVADALATVRPAGNVSVKATPVSGSGFPAGFVTVNVSKVVAFSATPDGLKVFAIEGCASTFRLADAVPPAPPSVEVTFPEVSFLVPAVVPVTFMENVHEVLAARLAPDKLTEFAPCVAVIVPPPQDPVRPFGVETTKPAGNVSPKPTPVIPLVALLFWTVKLKEVDPFKGMLAAPKALIRTGAPTIVMLAFDVFPVPPSVEVTATLLFLRPGVVPVTFKDTAHDAFAARAPPDRLTDEAPTKAVAVPPQVLLKLFGVATTSPAGKVSVKVTPVSGNVVFGFCMVNVRLVVPPSGADEAPNAFRIEGGVATVRFAVAMLPVPPFVEVTLPVVFVY